MSATVARRNFFIFLRSPEIQSVASVLLTPFGGVLINSFCLKCCHPSVTPGDNPTACGTAIRGDSMESQTGLKDALSRNPHARKRVRFISRRHAGAFSNQEFLIARPRV